MKHRVLDLLACPSCGSSKLSLTVQETKQALFTNGLTQVRCQRVCSFKGAGVSLENVTPRDCAECYAREIVAGTIRCSCGGEYPIVRGIPRLLPDSLSAEMKRNQQTFSLEWKMFKTGERNWGQEMEYRKALFLQGMRATPEDLKGKLILDAGCGSGALSIEMAKSFQMEVLGLDLAFGIEKAYQRNDSPFVYFVQGSVLDLPNPDRSFDFLYCAGVLVALPDTRTGFKAIIRKLKPGGRCFIWVYHPITKDYHPNDLTKMRIYNWIRKNVTSPMPINLQYPLYIALVPLFYAKRFVERLFGIRPSDVTWREKVQDLVDMFSPIYQNRHEPQEVIDWFTAEGFTNVVVSDPGPYGFGVCGDLRAS